MLRHARSFVALRPEAFEEARAKELSEGQTSVCLRGDPLAGANPLDYEGGFVSVGRAASSGAQTDLAIAAVIKLASGSVEGPELLRLAQRPRYAQFLTSADESLHEPRKPAATSRRVGRAAPPHTPVDTSKGTGGAMTPEVAWAEAAGGGGGGSSPGAGEADVLVAQASGGRGCCSKGTSWAEVPRPRPLLHAHCTTRVPPTPSPPIPQWDRRALGQSRTARRA